MADLQIPINRSFEVLPEELVAKILVKLPENERQVTRSVSKWLSYVIQEWFGLEVVMKGSNRSRMPSSLYQGQITRLSLQDVWSANPHRLPPTPRLRKLEFSGVMRLGNLFNLLIDSPNLKELFITCPEIVGNETFDSFELPSLKLTHFQLKIASNPKARQIEGRILELLAKASFKFLQSFRIVFEGEPFPNNYLILLESLIVSSPGGSKRDVLAFEEHGLLLKQILQGSNGILKELSLARPYSGLPLNTSNLLLEKLELNWKGDDLWLKDLLEGQGSNKLLRVLSLSCSTEFWMDGIVQRVVRQLKDTLIELHINLFNKPGQRYDEDFDMSFFLQCSKLKSFSYFTEWDLHTNPIPDLRTVYNTFEDLTSVVIPPRLERVVLGGPYRPEAFTLFCTHPNLKHLKLVSFGSDSTEGIVLDQNNDFYFKWEWLKNLILNSPQLREVILDGVLCPSVFDIGGFKENANSLPGVRINVNASTKSGYFVSLHVDEPVDVPINFAIPMEYPLVQLEISRI